MKQLYGTTEYNFPHKKVLLCSGNSCKLRESKSSIYTTKVLVGNKNMGLCLYVEREKRNKSRKRKEIEIDGQIVPRFSSVCDQSFKTHSIPRGWVDRKQISLHNNFLDFSHSRGQSYKANFGINYIKNGFNQLNFTLNYVNFDVIYAKKVL